MKGGKVVRLRTKPPKAQVIKFKGKPITPRRRRFESATVIILPTIRVERF